MFASVQRSSCIAHSALHTQVRKHESRDQPGPVAVPRQDLELRRIRPAVAAPAADADPRTYQNLPPPVPTSAPPAKPAAAPSHSSLAASPGSARAARVLPMPQPVAPDRARRLSMPVADTRLFPGDFESIFMDANAARALVGPSACMRR